MCLGEQNLEEGTFGGVALPPVILGAPMYLLRVLSVQSSVTLYEVNHLIASSQPAALDK